MRPVRLLPKGGQSEPSFCILAIACITNLTLMNCYIQLQIATGCSTAQLNLGKCGVDLRFQLLESQKLNFASQRTIVFGIASFLDTHHGRLKGQVARTMDDRSTSRIHLGLALLTAQAPSYQRQSSPTYCPSIPCFSLRSR